MAAAATRKTSCFKGLVFCDPNSEKRKLLAISSTAWSPSRLHNVTLAPVFIKMLLLTSCLSKMLLTPEIDHIFTLNVPPDSKRHAKTKLSLSAGAAYFARQTLAITIQIFDEPGHLELDLEGHEDTGLR